MSIDTLNDDRVAALRTALNNAQATVMGMHDDDGNLLTTRAQMPRRDYQRARIELERQHQENTDADE